MIMRLYKPHFQQAPRTCTWKTLKFIPPDGLAFVPPQDFPKDSFSLYIYEPFPNVVKYNIPQPQTALIDNTIPPNGMVMVTSAAKRSIRRDLDRGHGVVREGTPTKQLSQLVSPTAHPPYIIVLSKSKRPEYSYSSVHGSMVDYSSCCGLSTSLVAARVQHCSSTSRYRCLPYYTPHYSHHINAVWLIVSRCCWEKVVFFCSDILRKRLGTEILLQLDVTFIRFRPSQSY